MQTRYTLGMLIIGLTLIALPVLLFIEKADPQPEISAQEYNWVLLDLTDDSAFNSSPSGKAYRSLLRKFMGDDKIDKQEFRQLTSIRSAYLQDKAQSRVEQIHAAILEALEDGATD